MLIGHPFANHQRNATGVVKAYKTADVYILPTTLWQIFVHFTVLPSSASLFLLHLLTNFSGRAIYLPLPDKGLTIHVTCRNVYQVARFRSALHIPLFRDHRAADNVVAWDQLDNQPFGRMSMRLRKSLSLASVSLLSIAVPAYAQEAPGDDTAVDETIIVEARRREENVQDVPQVVNAVTAATIEKLNIRSATEITSVVPGLSLTVNANGIGSSSSMRGINHDVNVSGENGTIQYYVNDVPVASNFALQAIYDVGQITVERGPQGTLRGRSTPSGAININWRKPDLSEVGGYAMGTVGSDAEKNFQFGIGVPVIKDVLAVRVAGMREDNRGNRVRSVNSTELPTNRTESIRAQVRFEPTDFIKMGFTYEGMRTRARQFDQSQSMSLLIPGYTLPAVEQAFTTSVAPFLTPTVPAQRAVNYGTIDLKDLKSINFFPRTTAQNFKYFGWNAEVDFAGQRLIYLGSKLSFTFNPVTNNDSGAIFSTQQLTQETYTQNSGLTHEVRLQNDERVAGMFDYVVGFFRQTGEPETRLTTYGILEGSAPIFAGTGDLRLYNVATINNPTNIYLPKGKTTETSWFGNLTAHIGEATELSGGLRQVGFKSTAAGLFISCTPAQFAAGSCVLTPGTNNAYDVSKLIYNVTLRHKFTDSLMVYAATGSSFRPPVRAIGDFSTSYSPLETAHTSFGPETSKSYEIGFKSDWMDRKVTFNMT
ncbi:MAG: TonB-dependent receptor [Novosphingobium sp.]